MSADATSVIVGSFGPHTLSYQALDVAGNTSAPATAAFKVTRPLTRFEETDSHIAFSGTWTAGTSTSRSGGSWKYSNASGSAAYISFTGTGIDLISSKAPSYGIAKVTLDAQAPVTVDLYDWFFVNQQRVLSLTGLTDTAHTLKVEWTGTRNASSTGTVIGIDAIDVAGTLTQATAPVSLTRFEETDGRIAFGGTWAASASTARSGGSWKYSATSCSGAWVAFNGTRLDLIASKSPSYGIAKVVIDGGAPLYADLYASAFLHQQTVLSVPGLTAGAHTAVITWTGTRNAASTGTVIGIDAIDVAGTLTQATAPVSLTRFEETDGRIVLEGSWTAGASSSRSGGSWAYTNTATDTAWVSFTGTRIDLIASKAPSYGIARVTVDGGTPAYADLYGSSFTHKQTVFSAAGLASGPHTVKIEWTGTRNAASTGTVIGIDAIDVEGTLSQALAAHEETDTRIAAHGTWTSGASTQRSGGAWSYTTSPGAALYIKFKGTRIDLLSSKAPSYGIAKVTLDGSTTPTADLYDATFKHKQTVWSVSGLTDTVHTLVFEYVGSKNASSSGYVIGLDRVDCIGTLLQATDLSSALVRFEETSTKIAYAGTWGSGASTARSAGSWTYASAPATATVAFTGTRLDLIASKAPSYGIAKVVIDGGAPLFADLYSSGFLHQQTVLSVPGLTAGPHTAIITWTGTRNVASTGTVIGIDAVDVGQ